jgi:hypothetical protein
MASRRSTKSVDLGDVADLVERSKEIRKAYKALKKRLEGTKAGKGVPPAEIRKLADQLKRAISDAHASWSKPVLSLVPSRPSAPAVIARSVPRAGSASRRRGGPATSAPPRVVVLPPPSAPPSPAPRTAPPMFERTASAARPPILPAPRGRLDGALRNAVDWCWRFAPRALAVLVSR